MGSSQPELAERPTQSYERLEKFQRVHLILKSEKAEGFGAQVQDSALPDFMENASEAFAIYWQHMVVTVDSRRTIDAKLQGTRSVAGSDLSVITRGRSWKRDLFSVGKRLRELLPSDWDVA
jgi:hypothetical protein